MEPAFVAFVAIFLFAITTQTVTGFGTVILALTLGAHLYPVDVMLAWLVPTNLLITSYLLARYHQAVAWRLLVRRVLPAMGVGFIAGQALFYVLDTNALRWLLGVLVVALTARELLRRGAAGPLPGGLMPWSGAAGVCHGLFAAGGPLLVYGMARESLDKAAFRSTLSLIWTLMSIVLTVSYIAGGVLTAEALPHMAVLAAVTPAAVLVGEWLHHRVDETRFRQVVYAVLLVAGMFLLIR